MLAIFLCFSQLLPILKQCDASRFAAGLCASAQGMNPESLDFPTAKVLMKNQCAF
jgi:hypothetical protein